MVKQIEQRHLDFLEDAKNAFETDERLYTFRDGATDDSDTLIALRYGKDRDSVLIYELKECVANFVHQIEPKPHPRGDVMRFSSDMEKQLESNDHKDGWKEEHWCDLAGSLERNVAMLRKELMKKGVSCDPREVNKRCANIANFAMMIADNEGVHL